MIASGIRSPEAFECGENHRFSGQAGKSNGFRPFPYSAQKKSKAGDIRRTQKAHAKKRPFRGSHTGKNHTLCGEKSLTSTGILPRTRICGIPEAHANMEKGFATPFTSKDLPTTTAKKGVANPFSIFQQNHKS
jgi:hypothetical protein